MNRAGVGAVCRYACVAGACFILTGNKVMSCTVLKVFSFAIFIFTLVLFFKIKINQNYFC